MNENNQFDTISLASVERRHEDDINSKTIIHNKLFTLESNATYTMSMSASNFSILYNKGHIDFDNRTMDILNRAEYTAQISNVYFSLSGDSSYTLSAPVGVTFHFSGSRYNNTFRVDSDVNALGYTHNVSSPFLGTYYGWNARLTTESEITFLD